MSGTNAIGDAGEYLTLANLLSKQFKAGLWRDDDTDILLLLGREYRRIQVKSSETSRTFTSGGYWGRATGKDGERLTEKKRFTEYDVHAFAFCYLPDPFPYYVAIEAMQDSMNFAPACFTKRGRDDSFNELLARWGVVRRNENPITVIDGEWKQTSLLTA